MKYREIFRQLLVSIVILFSAYAHANVTVGIVSNQPNQITITYRSDVDFTERPLNIWNSQVLTIRWSVLLGNDIITSFSNPAAFQFELDGGPIDGGDGYFYQKFTSASTNIEQDLAQDEILAVLKISVFSSQECYGDFELVSDTDITNTNFGTASVNEVFGEKFKIFDPSVVSQVTIGTSNVLPVWYADGDQDGFGDAAVTQFACTQPDNYVDNADDCDDTNPAVNAGGTEICNGIDDDCNGQIDDGFDQDGDGICEEIDNCPGVANAGQIDSDGDGIGDACDTCPLDPDNDGDGDGICSGLDNCPNLSNPDQLDADGDGLGDSCDTCPFDPDNDVDNDGICGDLDNCPDIPDPDQLDSDGDGLGDACDSCPFDADNDWDGDGICGDLDNCPDNPNPDQLDSDGDGLGDACDDCTEGLDADADGICDDIDNCLDTPNFTQLDTDGDGLGDACDPCPFDPDNDVDSDGICGNIDICPEIANPDQSDTDNDGMGDPCDPCPLDPDNDLDGDGVCGDVDFCPTAVCQDITVQLDATGSATITAADVDGGSTGDCDIQSITIDRSSFGCSDVGPQTVTLTVTDLYDISTCETTVTIEDNLPPTAACQDITISIDENGIATFLPEDIDNGSTDNCAVTSLSLDINSFDCSQLGEHTVTLTAADAAGNSHSCEALVTVIDDTAPNAACRDITVGIDDSGTASFLPEDIDNGSTDNCAITSLSLDVTSFDCSQLGEHTVTLAVGDAAGHSSTCQATVTVQDILPPTAACQDITVSLDENGVAAFSAAQVNYGSGDNCHLIGLSLDINSFGCGDVGEQTVTLTITDASQNSSSCQATVTVQDDAPPIARCKNLGVRLDANGSASLTAEQIDDGSSDNCEINTMDIDVSSFGAADLGDHTVTLTVTDIHGHSASCTAAATVLEPDAPFALCRPHTVNLDANGEVVITAADVDGGSSVAGAIAALEVSPNTFGCPELGDNTVTLTITDDMGQSASCQAVVTVEDIDDVCGSSGPCPFDPDNDIDGDGICGDVDNCPTVPNPDQIDLDMDGIGAACDVDIDINVVVDNLTDYIEGLNLTPGTERALVKRLQLAARKFCQGASPGTIIQQLENLIGFIQYQSGIQIPADAADYLIAQIQALIDAIFAGAVECPPTSTSRPFAFDPGHEAGGMSLTAYPNPFSGQLIVQLFLPEPEQVTLEVFNLQGQSVRLLGSTELDAGMQHWIWDGTNEGGQILSAGVYLLRLKAKGTLLIHKVSWVP